MSHHHESIAHRLEAEGMGEAVGTDSLAFGDRGEPVIAVMPVTSTEAQEEDPTRDIRLETIDRVLSFLVADRPKPEALGRMVYALAFALGHGERMHLESQHELAAWLHMPRSTLSELLQSIRTRARLLASTSAE